jgi:RNA polymerase sigma factor (sigma-70 family)
MVNGKSQTWLFLQQWNQGDQEGLNALVERHIPWIRAHVSRRLGPLLRKKGDTCDYVQDAMIQFLQYGPRIHLSDENHFRALLARIIENTLRKKHDWYTARRREIARERPLPSDTILCLDPQQVHVRTPSQSAGGHEEEAWIRLGMELLDPEDCEVLVLRQWDNLSFAEVGEHLGISTEAARKRNNRAVLRLSDVVLALRRRELDSLLECV